MGEGIDVFGVSGIDIFSSIRSISETFKDDVALQIGTGGTTKLLYETADANANELILVFPEGGATDVPVFVLGDASIDNVDLTWFNGVTEPTIAVVNDAADAYASLDAGDDGVAGSKGLYFKAAADEDIELLNLSVTGTPRLYWDESEDQFRSTKGWVFDAACDVQGTWVATAAWTIPAVTLGGTVTGGANILSNLGMVYIGDTADANVTLGLVINQGAADNAILTLKSSDVSHPFTGQFETDTYGYISKVSSLGGGLGLIGASDSAANGGDASGALYLAGYLGQAAATGKATDSTGRGIVRLNTYITDGSTSVASPGADANLVSIESGGDVRFIFDQEGSGHADVGWVTYAKHDDLALVKDIEQELLLREDEPKTQRRHLLEDIGIIGKDSWHMENGHPKAMVNFTKLAMLHHGALMQANERIVSLENKILALTGG